MNLTWLRPEIARFCANMIRDINNGQCKDPGCIVDVVYTMIYEKWQAVLGTQLVELRALTMAAHRILAWKYQKIKNKSTCCLY